jgi:hypothetical protein
MEHSFEDERDNLPLARCELIVPGLNRVDLRSLPSGDLIAVQRLSNGVQQLAIMNGLDRNSAAPAFMARTVVGMAPRPVTKMMESSDADRPTGPGNRVRSFPAIAPRERDTKGGWVAGVVKNLHRGKRYRMQSGGRNKLVNASRTDGSSSTTKTIRSVSAKIPSGGSAKEKPAIGSQVLSSGSLCANGLTTVSEYRLY